MTEEIIKIKIEKIIDAVMKVAAGDYSIQVEVSEDYDYLDALVMGMNMMIDDIKKGRESELENDRINLLNIQLKEALIKAEESERLKSAFLANMSHEIRTPMNGILGFADLLKDPNLTGKEQHDYINIIEKSGVRLLNIINDIIDISKIEANLMITNLEETDINAQVEYIYNFFQPEVEKKGLHFSIKNSLPANEALINTDSEKLYAIFMNLVKNAIKYTKEGSIELGYNLKANRDPIELEFFVKDSGIGIPKSRQTAIFERFIQVDVDVSSVIEGTGLGLAITKAYVEMLGGKIWVESEQGEGSIFYFTLPYNVEKIEFDIQTGTPVCSVTKPRGGTKEA